MDFDPITNFLAQQGALGSALDVYGQQLAAQRKAAEHAAGLREIAPFLEDIYAPASPLEMPQVPGPQWAVPAPNIAQFEPGVRPAPSALDEGSQVPAGFFPQQMGVGGAPPAGGSSALEAGSAQAPMPAPAPTRRSRAPRSTAGMSTAGLELLGEYAPAIVKRREAEISSEGRLAAALEGERGRNARAGLRANVDTRKQAADYARGMAAIAAQLRIAGQRLNQAKTQAEKDTILDEIRAFNSIVAGSRRTEQALRDDISMYEDRGQGDDPAVLAMRRALNEATRQANANQDTLNSLLEQAPRGDFVSPGIVGPRPPAKPAPAPKSDKTPNKAKAPTIMRFDKQGNPIP